MNTALRTITLALAGLVAAWLPQSSAFAQQKLRISLDTNATHVRNISAEKFAEELKKRVGNKLVVEIYPSAQLFRDRDIPKALRQNAIEMGIPGTWQLDGVAPDTAIPTLPMFYGLDENTVHKVLDGKLGEFISKRTEEQLKVKIIGKWVDLGMNHYYSVSKPLTKYADLNGMKIRFPGGSANSARVKGLGGNPVLIPWPDLPLAMSQGVVDAVQTTHESVFTAKLWDSGLKYCFEDHQAFAQYIPMVSLDFWNKQPKDIQNAILAAWEAMIGGERVAAAKAQIAAREVLIKNGIKMSQPLPAEIDAARKRLMAAQDGLVKEMKIDPNAVQVGLKELRAAKVVF